MQAQQPPMWVDAVDLEDVPEGQVKGVRLSGQFIALYRHGGQLYATSDICTHEYALLSGGWLENDEIECPLHGTRFRITDGSCLGPFGHDLRCFQTRVRRGRIEVALSPEDTE
jgi:naphthalene 1,2-dioxygenase system ferredoxin subunit